MLESFGCDMEHLVGWRGKRRRCHTLDACPIASPFGRCWQARHPPRYAAFIQPSSPRFTHSSVGIIADQTIALDGFSTRKDYPVHLRRIRFKDAESGKGFVFLTNQFALPAASICALYKSRWQVELFFKWIKQHLRIKQFYGTSDNAVRTQIWIAVSIYVLVAIVKKRLALDASLYTLLQIFSVTLFEKVPMSQAFFKTRTTSEPDEVANQLNLFAY